MRPTRSPGLSLSMPSCGARLSSGKDGSIRCQALLFRPSRRPALAGHRGADQNQTAKPVAKSFWTNLALWRWSTAGFAGAAAALALWIAVTPAPRPSLVAILHPPQQDQASWIATAGRSGLVLRAVTSAAPPSDRAFELWAIAPGATQPRSLGVISPNGELKLSRLPVDLRDGATLAISIEPLGGSPTRLPSGPVVYIGSVKAV